MRNEQDSVFELLCADLISYSQTADNEISALNLTVRRFKQWNKLLEHQRKSLMDESNRKGLLGELIYLCEVIDGGYPILPAVQGWVGPDGADQDFVYADNWHEVKSVGVSADSVKISSLEQLANTDPGELVVMLIDKCAPEHSGAVSLGEQVDHTFRRVHENDDAYSLLESKLMRYGFIDLPEYREQKYVCSGEIKHIYCAHLLMQEHQELVIENLLNVFFVKQDLIQLIGKNCSISDETALSILRIASLSPDTMGYYANGNARSAPFIQISEHQYLRTIKGLLDEPFDFILYNIRNFFPEAWDKNVNQREAVFRTQLYTVFDDPRFSCVQHPVIIKEKNKTLTDIDAVVIDKKTGEIALFQLKWQDPADYSPFTLKSKRSNYYSAAEKWLEIIEKWLSNSADEDIASKLGVKVKYFDKKKISIFVLGRRRGNYSGNGPYPYECAWSQWYQIMYAASYLRQENEFTISNLYKLIVSTSPFNIKISEKPVTFCYGKYRIKFGGKTFCGKDTR